MIVTEKHMPGPNNPWCHDCGRHLNKAHARDCVYLKETPVYHIYRATARGQIAERLTVHLPPRHTDFGWKADYADAHGRMHTIDMEFVEEIDGHPAVINTGAAWYSRHPFVVMENGRVFGPTDKDFELVEKELMTDKLGEAYEPNANGDGLTREKLEAALRLFDWRRPDRDYPGLPLEAQHKRGAVWIKLSREALAYIAEEVMPDEWGLDPSRQKVVVDDPRVLADAVTEALNREDEQGWTLARSCIEQALTRVMEHGEPGLEIVDLKGTE